MMTSPAHSTPYIELFCAWKLMSAMGRVCAAAFVGKTMNGQKKSFQVAVNVVIAIYAKTGLIKFKSI